MRFVRLPYSGIADRQSPDVDIANKTRYCMLEQYNARNLGAMFACWSSATSFDHYAKSADLGSVCPFHYNRKSIAYLYSL